MEREALLTLIDVADPNYRSESSRRVSIKSQS